jgi:hypothetical protein
VCINVYVFLCVRIYIYIYIYIFMCTYVYQKVCVYVLFLKVGVCWFFVVALVYWLVWHAGV